MALKQFVKESFLYTLSALLTRAILFLVIPLYIAYLSPDNFGLVNLFQMYLGFGTIFILCGFDQGLLRFFPKSNNVIKKGYFTSAIIPITIISFIIIMIVILFRSFWSRILFDNRINSWQILWFVSVLISEALYLIVGVSLKANREVKRLLYLNVTKFTVFLISTFVTLHFYHLEIYGVFFSFLISNGIYLIASIQVWKYFQFELFSFQKLKDMVQYGLPLAPNIVFALILFQADHYLLKELCGLTIVGYYAFGYKIGGMLIYILWIVNNAWMPHLFHLEEKEIPAQLTKILLWTMLLAMLSYLLIDSLAQLLGEKLLPESYWPSLPIITWVGFAYLIFIFTNIIDTILHFHKQVRIIPMITGISALLNVGLNLMFIPKYEMMGAVLATVISFLLACLLTLIFLIHKKWILFDWIKIFRLFFIFTITKAGILLSSTFSQGVTISLHIFLLIGFVCVVLFVFPEFKVDILQGIHLAKQKINSSKK